MEFFSVIAKRTKSDRFRVISLMIDKEIRSVLFQYLSLKEEAVKILMDLNF
jgi:hypothetical protein